MIRGGVVPVAKHFPGLGAVTGNTDFQAGVTDSSTTATSPSVSVYATLIRNGLPAVMVGTAVYPRIAPGVPAAFSPAVVAQLLRGQLGFAGVVMTDDVSQAKQVAAWSPEQRAVLAIQAGVDIVLVSASPQLAPQMIAAVVAKARAEPAFRAQVDAAATRVLALKQRYPAAP
jgi:beta-N-acetylhexosaminidase